MTRGRRLPASVLALLVSWSLLIGGSPTASAAPAAEAGPTSLSLTASGGYAGGPVRLVAVLSAEAVPVPAAPVTIERRSGGGWATVGTATTDDAGRVRLTGVRAQLASANVFRARFEGDATRAPSTSGRVASVMTRRGAVLDVSGPRTVVDERSTVVRVRWTTAAGAPVRGRVQLWRRDGAGPWVRDRSVRTSTDGRAVVKVRPRFDTRWKATSPGADWIKGARSDVHALDNLPPTTPVALPAGAPRPKVGLPRQQRAAGDGARPVVSRIPDAVWGSMVGRSWHAGCPVGRDGLRLLRINYWGYDGYRYRGEVVAAAGAAPKMAAALSAMYAARLPIRSMYRVDRFGWSKALQGADDYASMDAGNTSAFNCRSVVNRPGVRSPHSYGGSLDVNPWENPYRSATGLVPNTWWASRSHPRVAWRSSSHPVVELMRSNGMRWTYGTGDSHHFDATSHGRVVVATRVGRPAQLR